jgi:hypothetical protein
MYYFIIHLQVNKTDCGIGEWYLYVHQINNGNNVVGVTNGIFDGTGIMGVSIGDDYMPRVFERIGVICSFGACRG